MERIFAVKGDCGSYVDWEEMDSIIKIIPELKNRFRSKRCEYIFEVDYNKPINVTIEILDLLSKRFTVELDSKYIIVQI